VAGYYDLAPGGSTRLLELPDQPTRKKAGPHYIQLLLGRDSIQNAELQNEER